MIRFCDNYFGSWLGQRDNYDFLVRLMLKVDIFRMLHDGESDGSILDSSGVVANPSICVREEMPTLKVLQYFGKK